MSNQPQENTPHIVELDREDLIALLQTVAACTNCYNCREMVRDALLLAGIEVQAKHARKRKGTQG